MTAREPHSEPPEVRMVNRWSALVEHGLEGETVLDDPFDEDPRERAMLYDVRDVEGRPE